MLPITFDRDILHSLPATDDAARARVVHLLHTIAVHRVVPHLAAHEDSDAVLLARAADRTAITRLEDPGNRLDLVALLTARDGEWSIEIHERIFDFLAFAFPTSGDSSEQLNDVSRRAFALAEFILRHQFHHLVLPDHSEVAVVAADIAYAASHRRRDTPFFASLVDALTDDTIGLRAHGYLELFELAEEDENDLQMLMSNLIGEHFRSVCDADPALLRRVFAGLRGPDRTRLLLACLERGGDESLPVTRRAENYRGVVALLENLRREGGEALRGTVEELRVRGFAPSLLSEMGLRPDLDFDDEQDWNHFGQALRSQGAVPDQDGEEPPATPSRAVEPSLDGPVLVGENPRLTLKERVEQARRDPRVPAAVLGAIDANESNLQGHSRTKYTEFIDTLLSVPWGRLQKLDVGPREFTLGLDQSHFGLDRPKELVGDFFANLLWRYREFSADRAADWKRTGSAFLFVGPPGVGKTSLAISIARTLGIPYHKVSLGGMRDEGALRGHGFTYEGSKPGAIVQGLIKMGVMNGMFILDEADKTEAFAIATLLEILDPEQNHLFHDKYTMSTVDIDLSNCHFILTANTLETVPAPVLDRCQVVELGRYSVEEKVHICRRHLLPRLRDTHDIPEHQVHFEPEAEEEHLRMIIRDYTHEAGVRQLELVLRSLLLRVQRRLVFEQGRTRVVMDHNLVRDLLEEPVAPRTIEPDDLVGEVAAIGVNPERGVGSLLPVQVTPVPGADSGTSVSVLHATGNLEKVMDESRTVATTAILHNAEALGVDAGRLATPIHLHVMGSSSKKDGPSAGIAIALALTSQLTGLAVRRDVAATGEIGTRGRLTGIGGLDIKLETAIHAGCTTLIIPRENLTGPAGISGLPKALVRELQVLDYDQWRDRHDVLDHSTQLLQVVAVDHLIQAWEVASVDPAELDRAEDAMTAHAHAFRSAVRGVMPAPPAIVVKSEEEIEGSGRQDLCAGCSGCHLVVASTVELPRDVTERAGSIRSADTAGGLARSLAAAVDERLQSGEAPAVVGPYFVLRDAGLLDRDDVVAIASNWFADGRKLHSGRALVHRAACRLLRHGPEALQTFPMLRRTHGVWAISLEILPEKYRLDLGRCERLLDRYLGRWLAELA